MIDVTHVCADCLGRYHGDCHDPDCTCCFGQAPRVGDEPVEVDPYDDEYRDAA